jgi:hypothetical protein
MFPADGQKGSAFRQSEDEFMDATGLRQESIVASASQTSLFCMGPAANLFS